MEIIFPLEFVVFGTAVSLQAKAHSRTQWKDRVRQSATAALPQPHLSSEAPMGVTIFYFPEAALQGDIDNRIKLVLDALNGLVYADDSQVHRVLIQKFEPDSLYTFADPSEVLRQALSGPPALYVRISDDPTEELA